LAQSRTRRQSADQASVDGEQARKEQSKPLIERPAGSLAHPERLAHDLHVLLRHRLLLQADRFAGFGPIEIDLGAGDLPIAEGEHACVDDLDLRRAPLDRPKQL
jgi:hypothetical protein